MKLLLWTFLFLIASQLVNIDFKERYKEYLDGVISPGCIITATLSLAVVFSSINMSLVDLLTGSGIAIIASGSPTRAIRKN